MSCYDTIVQALCAADPVLARLIERVGPFRPPFYTELSPFQMLMRAVVAQQVSKHAATAIVNRVYAHFPGSNAPTAADIQTLDDATLRAAGISRQKVAAIRSLAQAVADGSLPDRETLDRMGDAEIREAVTAFKGIGPWTADMLLIFSLARLDVLPATDLGVRRGFSIAFELDTLPTPDALRAHAEAWRPHRAVAAWYLWRANDL